MAFWAVLDADFGDEHAFRDERREPFGSLRSTTLGSRPQTPSGGIRSATCVYSGASTLLKSQQRGTEPP